MPKNTILLRPKTTKPLSKNALLIFALLIVCAFGVVRAQAQTVGTTTLDNSKAFDGYTLFSPITWKGVFLIDNEGRVVHMWNTTMPPGQAVMLLEDGSLLRTANPGGQLPMSGGGTGGILEKFAWDGTRTWRFDHYGATFRTHHDVEILPNGNVLLIVWESKTPAEALAVGRQANRITENAVWTERIIEVKQTGPESGEIVWEWAVWDHLIQNIDDQKPNYGTVNLNPKRVDINAGGTRTDWLHINSVRYNAERDEILVSVHNLNEIWIISRTTGDIVYRFGNPIMYGRGTFVNQVLYGQHDARWIPAGLPDAGKIMLFNNGQNRATTDPRSYSTVEIIAPPIDASGYILESGKAYGPTQAQVVYPPSPLATFFATNISGATRLSNGNTLSCLGTTGTFVEFTPTGEVVWNYISPVSGTGILKQGQKPINNQIFKVYKYAKNYPAFTGRALSPMGKLEDGPLYASDDANPSSPSASSTGIPSHWFAFGSEVTILVGQGAMWSAQTELHAYDLLGRNLGVVAKPPLPAGVNTITVPIGTFIVK